MRFKGLDLNLIVTLDTLLERGSVSRTAERLNLTQPAVSAALARLRSFFGDELLVPTGRRMIPTPLAEELRPLARQLVDHAALFIGTSNAFDPATSRRCFKLATADHLVAVLIAPVLRRLQQVAPGVRLDLVPLGADCLDRLDQGEIDLMIAPAATLSLSAPRELLFRDDHVLVGWAENPALRAPPDLDGLFALGHVAVQAGPDRDAPPIEHQLERYRDRRSIEVTTTQAAAVPWLVAGTSRVGILPRRMAESFRKLLPLILHPLPFDTPPLEELVQYHATRQNDAGLRWLIDQLRSVAGHPA